MRKILLNILILAVAIGSFLSPVSPYLSSSGNLNIRKNEALAGNDVNFNSIVQITLSEYQKNDKSATVNVNFKAVNAATAYNTLIDSSNILSFLLEWSDKSDFSDLPKTSDIGSLAKVDTIVGASQGKLMGYSDIKSRLKDIGNSTNGNGVDLRFPTGDVLKSSDTYYFRMVGLRVSTQSSAAAVLQADDKVSNTLPIQTGPPGSSSSNQQTSSTAITDPTDFLPNCGISFGFGSGSVYGCIIQVFYYAFWVPTSWLAGLAGKLLDFFLYYSINSSSYHTSGFVNEGWKVVRDISNIGFIFVLLYIALRTILNLGGSQNQKMIKNVIIIALLINFSLFFTEVIIDSGNILAGVLYNDIGARAQKNGQVVGTTTGDFGEKSVSASLVDQFDPQKIVQNAGVTQENVDNIKTPILVIIILSTIVNVFMLTTFLSLMFLFAGRVVGLMFAMIFSPFAFISLTIPGSGKVMKQWAWDNWLSELISVTFMAPIFVFFLWLILLFLGAKGGLLGDLFSNASKSISLGTGGQVLSNFIAVIAPFVIILALLKKAKEVTEGMAGEVATTLSGYAKSAVGTIGGAALGGAAFAGRAIAGRAASAVATGAFQGGAGEAGAEGAARIPIRPITPIVPGQAPFRPARTQEQTGEILRRVAEERFAPANISNTNIPSGQQNAPAPFLRPGATPPTVRETPGQILEAQQEKNRLADRTRQENEAKETRERLQGLGLATAGTFTPVPQPNKETPPPPPPTLQTPPTIPQNNPPQTPAKPEETNKPAPTIGLRRIETPKPATPPTPPAPEAPREDTLKGMAAAAPESIFRKFSSFENFINSTGKVAFDVAKYLGSEATFDARNTKLMQSFQKATGFDFGKGQKDSFDKWQENISKADIDYAKKLTASGKETQELNQMQLDLAKMANKDQIDAIKEKVKQNKELNEDEEKIFKLNSKAEKEDKRIKALNAKRQATYADTVQKGTIFGYTPTQQESAKKIRALSKDKPAKDKIWEDLQKAFEENKKAEEGSAPKPDEKPKEDAGGGDKAGGKK